MLDDRGVIDFRGRMDASEAFVRTVINSYMLSAALFSMVKFDLFTHLAVDETLSLAKLAERCGLHVDQVVKLVSVARSIGLIVQRDGLLSVSDAARRLLSRNSPRNLCDAVLHHKEHVYPLFGGLDKSLQTRRPVLSRLDLEGPSDDFFALMGKHEVELGVAMGAMNTFSRGVGDAIAGLIAVEWPRAEILDLCGGGGQVAIDLALALTGVTISLFDRAPVAAYAAELVAHHGLGERIGVVSGDVFDQLPFGDVAFDVVLLSSVLGDCSPAQQVQVLAHARRCLKPGGLLIISETLLDDDRSGPILPTLMSLYQQVMMTPGAENFTAAQLNAVLSANGFADIRVHDNRARQCRDSVTARKA